MLPVEKAREIILGQITPLPPEKLCLEAARGRYLAEDVTAPFDIPLVTNSAMDGYAVRLQDITSEATRLTVIYDLPAGATPARALGEGEAVRIMTGAPIPEGADAVVMREMTEEHASEVIIRSVPQRGDHFRFRGEDIHEGDVVLEHGDLLEAAQIGVLASLKHSLVHVHQRPIVAVLSTGDEVVDLDEDLSPGKVVASNAYTLSSLIRGLGAIAVNLGIARDTRADLECMMGRAARADLLLSSGGVSMGDYDIVKEVMSAGTNRMEFWQVAMKPGKPLAFGIISGVPTIGLPGNPVSSMISFYQFARPAILKMLGSRQLLLPRITARIMEPIRKKADRPHYIRGILAREGSDLCVRTTGPQGSGILTSMAKANCFIVLPAETTQIHPGDSVECEVFHPVW